MSTKTYNKPLTKTVDDQVRKGGSWDKILANINRIASRRGLKNYRKTHVKTRIKQQLKKDEDYYGGEVEITNEGINIK